jgi:hypothetical protein
VRPDPTQQRQVEGAPDGSAHLSDLFPDALPIEASHQQRLQGRGDLEVLGRGPDLHDGPGHLLQEKRYAVGARGDLGDRGVADLAPGAGVADEGGRFVRLQPLQLDALEAPVRRPVEDEVAPERQHHQVGRSRQALQHLAEHGQRRGVGPLEIVEAEDQRLQPGQREQPFDECLHHAPLEPLGAEHGRRIP